MIHPHRQRGEEGGAVPLQPQLVTKKTHKRLQMHNQEHPVELYHHLVCTYSYSFLYTCVYKVAVVKLLGSITC